MTPQYKIVPYTYPNLYEGKEPYVGFYAIDPATGKMKRKRYKIAHIHGKAQRMRYAQRMIHELMVMLDSGWNPFSPEDPAVTPPLFEDVCERYTEYVENRTLKGTLRPDTARSYYSYLRVFRKWCAAKKISSCDQISKNICAEFLDYIYMNASACTRNCYKVWMSGSFFTWMQEHGIIKVKPTDGIKSLPKPKEPKSRLTIPEKELVRLKDYLERENPHYLLVVYLLYYCFIRPKEMSMLKVGDFHLAKGMITIPGRISKNGKTEDVTLPAKVIHYMIDLGIFNYAGDNYVFSEKFKPGRTYCKPKTMSDWWRYHIVRDLKWPKNYVLYSLKDTGITRLLHTADPLTVRNQARHSDISITNIYAQNDGTASELIRNLNDVL